MIDAVIHLVRHGEVENPNHLVYGSLAGFELSRRGRRQAQAAAERLAGRDIVSIIASPIQRAVETSAIVAAALELSVQIGDQLVEWRLGERWAGTAWEDLDTTFPGELTAYLDHPERLEFAPETLGDLAVRVSAAVEHAAARAGSGEVVLVSHQDPIQAGRLALIGMPLAGLQSNKPGHCSIVTLVKKAGAAHWTEAEYWEPAQGTIFPPITAEAG